MKELQEVLANFAEYPNKVRARRHYEGLQWEAENKTDIEAKLQELLDPSSFLDAVEDLPLAAIETAIKYLHNEDWAALGSLIGLSVHAYMWREASEQVLYEQEQQQLFESEDASLTDAERNGVRGSTPLDEL